MCGRRGRPWQRWQSSGARRGRGERGKTGTWGSRECLTDRAAETSCRRPLIIRRRMKRIAVIPGDGIGPEVIAAGMRVLEHLNGARKLDLEFVHFGWNADEYLR